MLTKIGMAVLASTIGLSALGGTAKADELRVAAPAPVQVRYDHDGDRVVVADRGYYGYGDRDYDRFRDRERFDHERRERMEREWRRHHRRWFRGWDRF